MKKLTALLIMMICMLSCFAQEEQAYIDFSQEEPDEVIFVGLGALNKFFAREKMK